MWKFGMRVVAALGLMGAVAASAGTYEGETVKETVRRAGKNLRGDAQMTASLTATIYKVSYEMQWVNETVWDCEDELDSDGSRGDWKGFYDPHLPKWQKPGRLAEAIKGVGLSTAELLVEDGYFDRRPRSWRQFERIIEDAAAAYGNPIDYHVLVQYKRENMINLGYLVEGQCGYKTVRALRRVPVRQKHSTETQAYELRIVNAPLLPAEEETFTLSFDGYDDSLNVTSAYNNYEVERYESDGKVIFELKGSRRQVRPDNTLTVTATKPKGELEVRVSDAGFDAEAYRGAERHMIGKVYVDKRGWKGNSLLGEFRVKLSGNDGITDVRDLGITIPEGERILVEYAVQVTGSPYHSEKESPYAKLRLDWRK